MVPCIGVAIRGQKFYPLLNNEAMFRMQDEFPPDVLDQISKDDTKAGFKLAFDVFRMLCEEGEAVRRFYGYEPGPLPEWEEASLTYLPNDVVAVRTAVYQAITVGYGGELAEEAKEEVDIWLLELEKKTPPGPGE